MDGTTSCKSLVADLHALISSSSDIRLCFADVGDIMNVVLQNLDLVLALNSSSEEDESSKDEAFCSSTTHLVLLSRCCFARVCRRLRTVMFLDGEEMHMIVELSGFF